jgi:hypothetical protein
MKLHANARLRPKGRLLLCQRVLEQGWSLARAAEATGVSGAPQASGWAGIALRASWGSWIVPRPQRECRAGPIRRGWS